MDEKFIVFSRQDFDDFFTFEESYKRPPIDEVEDAVVIRTHDVFASQALFSYSNSVITAIEIMRECGITAENSPTQIKELQVIADYFHEQAVVASEVQRRLPD